MWSLTWGPGYQGNTLTEWSSACSGWCRNHHTVLSVWDEIWEMVAGGSYGDSRGLPSGRVGQSDCVGPDDSIVVFCWRWCPFQEGCVCWRNGCLQVLWRSTWNCVRQKRKHIIVLCKCLSDGWEFETLQTSLSETPLSLCHIQLM